MYFFCKPKYNVTIKRKHTVNKSFVSILQIFLQKLWFLKIFRAFLGSVAEGNITITSCMWEFILYFNLLFCIQIKISFLPVGHTHEDIDQFFSRISEHLKKQNIQTMSKLVKLIPNAYTKQKLTTTVTLLNGIFDMKTWFEGHINTMSRHSVPHVFKFTLNEQGKCVGYLISLFVWIWSNFQWFGNRASV